MVRWIFFAWGTVAAFVMAAILIAAATSSTRVTGDQSIIFGMVSLLGIPAWLIVAALTITGWRRLSHGVLAIQNSPALVAVIAFVVVQVQWAR
jgi:hypothetical protein